MGFFIAAVLVVGIFRETWSLFNAGTRLKYGKLLDKSKKKEPNDKTPDEKYAHTVLAWFALIDLVAIVVLIVLLFEEQFRLPAAAVLIICTINIASSKLPDLFKPMYYICESTMTIALYVWLIYSGLFI